MNNSIKSGFVYIVRCGDYYKIGKSVDPKKRLESLQTGSPLPLTLIATFPSLNAIQDERILHEHMASYSVRGEWFDIPDSLIANIESWFRTAHPAPAASIGVKSVKDEIPPGWEDGYTGFLDCLNKYELPGGYRNLSRDFSDGVPSAKFFLATEAESAIRLAVENEDYHILISIYQLNINPRARIPPVSEFRHVFMDLVRVGVEQASELAALKNAMAYCYPNLA